jgi:CheY-like chemotaxis protein
MCDGSAHRVLVVDDDPDQRDVLAMLLETEGYSVEAAASGYGALSRLEQGLDPCVIILDLMMDGMDGFEFRERQTSEPDPRIAAIPVVLFSAMRGLGAAATRLHAAGHAEKPDYERLIRLVAATC